jgi:hypothetical protein
MKFLFTLLPILLISHYSISQVNSISEEIERVSFPELNDLNLTFIGKIKSNYYFISSKRKQGNVSVITEMKICSYNEATNRVTSKPINFTNTVSFSDKNNILITNESIFIYYNDLAKLGYLSALVFQKDLADPEVINFCEYKSIFDKNVFELNSNGTFIGGFLRLGKKTDYDAKFILHDTKQNKTIIHDFKFVRNHKNFKVINYQLDEEGNLCILGYDNADDRVESIYDTRKKVYLIKVSAASGKVQSNLLPFASENIQSIGMKVLSDGNIFVFGLMGSDSRNINSGFTYIFNRALKPFRKNSFEVAQEDFKDNWDTGKITKLNYFQSIPIIKETQDGIVVAVQNLYKANGGTSSTFLISQKISFLGFNRSGVLNQQKSINRASIRLISANIPAADLNIPTEFVMYSKSKDNSISIVVKSLNDSEFTPKNFLEHRKTSGKLEKINLTADFEISETKLCEFIRADWTGFPVFRENSMLQSNILYLQLFSSIGIGKNSQYFRDLFVIR